MKEAEISVGGSIVAVADTGNYYGPDEQPELLLGRGYTGHEHLPWFGLINMNARLYDPAVHRFLSPDPEVQLPDNTQNYNRYTYCLNNPLRYTDPTGRIIVFDSELSTQEIKQLSDIIALAKESDLFRTFFESLILSDKTYTISIGFTSYSYDNVMDPGLYVPSKRLILLSGGSVNVPSVTEELYHAYQHEMQLSSIYNKEFEAKVVSAAVSLEVDRPYQFMGFEAMSSNIDSGKYSSGNSFLSPSDFYQFEADYIKCGSFFVGAHNPSIVPLYCVPVYSVPPTLYNLINQIVK